MAKNITDLFLKHSHISSNAAPFIQLIVIFYREITVLSIIKIELFLFSNLAIKLNKNKEICLPRYNWNFFGLRNYILIHVFMA